MIDRSRVREALTGPVASIHTPFLRDGEIDEKGLQNMIDHVIDAGSESIILTYGDSLYSVLTDEEVAHITKVTAEHVTGRAMVIAADRQWWTDKEIEFAKYAVSVGADLLMVLPPNWARSCTIGTFVEHYAAVAEHIPVMVVTNVFANAPDLGLKTLEVLRDEVEGVVAIKDDIVGAFARRRGLLLHEQWGIISGGQKQNHLDMLRRVFLHLHSFQTRHHSGILAGNPETGLAACERDYTELRFSVFRFCQWTDRRRRRRYPRNA